MNTQGNTVAETVHFQQGSNLSEASGFVLQSVAGAPPEYTLEFYRLFFIEAGEAEAMLDNWNLIVSPGDLVPLSPGEKARFDGDISVRSLAFHHDFYCVRVKRTEVYCDGVVFNRLTGEPRIKLPLREQRLIQERFYELSEIVHSEGILAYERAVNALRSILLQAAEYKMKQLEKEDNAELTAAPMSELVLRFQDLLEAYFLDHKDINFYSDLLNVSPTVLNRNLKSELGQTALQAVNERIAIAARVELRSGRKTVKEVAYDLGFEDPLYFSRFFKKQFGHSPSHYFANPPLKGESE
ncbi:MAG: helix-turn-helix domain-containing protein [Granulosicoccus sp.]